MNDPGPTITVSPRIGALLTEVTESPDLELALWKILSEYLDFKARSLQQRRQEFESKWGMTFETFSERCEARSLEQDPYSYQVESDFWEWEKTETLLRHYEALRARWM